MRQFKDNAGRAWTLAVNVDAVKRVRDLLKVDLLTAADGELIEKLYTDPVLLCDVVYCVCKPDADAAGVSDEAFGRAMAGDAIEHATVALIEELIDFFPNRRDRERARRVLAKFDAMLARVQDSLDHRLADPRIDQAIEKALADIGGSLPSLPGSPASTPGQ